MKKRVIVIALVVIALIAAALALRPRRAAESPAEDPVFYYSGGADSAGQGAPAEPNSANFAALLADLVSAYEGPSDADERTINADLEAIRAVDEADYAVAKAVADHWAAVFLDPDYELYIYAGEDKAAAPAGAGISLDRTHAIVVLGYELLDGQMQPELMGRCDAAAALARALPEAILVCSGGATGRNNPEGNTEAGLMKAYLAEQCAIDPGRIYIDEDAMTTAENAVNTLRILQEQGVRTMTIVTSTYHQRWGQALYNVVSELYRREYGYYVQIVGNYCYDIEPSVPVYAYGDRIAARQIAGILGVPEDLMPEQLSPPGLKRGKPEPEQ